MSIGIGAGLTAGVIVTFLTLYLQDIIFDTREEKVLMAKITEDREVIRNGTTVILGKVTNTSDEAFRSLSIDADLFDENGTFVEKCHTYVADLYPEKSENFKITCKKNCDSNKTVEHSSYKLMPSGF